MGVFLLGTLNSLFYPISNVHPPLVVNSEFMVNSKPDNTGLFWWTLQMSFSERPYVELPPGTLLGVGVKLLMILLCCLVTWRSNHMDVFVLSNQPLQLTCPKSLMTAPGLQILLLDIVGMLIGNQTEYHTPCCCLKCFEQDNPLLCRNTPQICRMSRIATPSVTGTLGTWQLPKMHADIFIAFFRESWKKQGNEWPSPSLVRAYGHLVRQSAQLRCRREGDKEGTREGLLGAIDRRESWGDVLSIF